MLSENQRKLIEENYALCIWFANKKWPNPEALSALRIDRDDLIELGHLALCKAAKKYDSEKSSFSNYFVTCVKHEILLEIRSRMRNKRKVMIDSLSYDRLIESEEGTTYLDLRADPKPGPLDVIISREVLDMARSIIDSDLSSILSNALKLWIFGVTQEAMGKQCGVTQTCMSRRITRAKSKLQAKIKAIGYCREDVV